MKPPELKQWRAANGYTQGGLAEVLGVALMTVSRWECGTREIPSFLHLALKAIPKKGGKVHRNIGTKSKRKEARYGTKRGL